MKDRSSRLRTAVAGLLATLLLSLSPAALAHGPTLQQPGGVVKSGPAAVAAPVFATALGSEVDLGSDVTAALAGAGPALAHFEQCAGGCTCCCLVQSICAPPVRGSHVLHAAREPASTLPEPGTIERPPRRG